MGKNFLYYLLIITAVFGYSLAVPFFPQLYLFHIVLFLLLFLCLITLLLKGKIKIKIKNIKLYFYFFCTWFLWILTSFLWVDNKSLAIKFTLIYLIMFSFLWLIIFYNRDRHILKTTLKVLFFISLIVLFVGTFEIFTSFHLPILSHPDLADVSINVRDYIPTSFFYNTNNYATFLMFSLPFYLFGVGYVSSKNKKIGLFIIIFLTIINVIMTDSRANILSCLFIIFVYLLFSLIKKFSFKKLSEYFFVFLMMISIFFLIINNNVFLKTRFENGIKVVNSILNKEYSLGAGGDSLSIRMTILKKMVFPPSSFNFLFGFGVGNSRNYLKEQNLPRQIVDPHNWWLEVLGEFGFIFFLCYLVFFFSLLRNLWKIMKSRKDSFIVFISSSCFFSLLVFIISSISPSSVVYFLPHWILMGLSIMTINLFKD